MNTRYGDYRYIFARHKDENEKHPYMKCREKADGFLCYYDKSIVSDDYIELMRLYIQDLSEAVEQLDKMTDKLGNTTELSFTIVEPTVTEFKHNFDDLAGFEKVLVNGEETRLNYGTLELFKDGEYEIVVVVNGDNNTFYINVDATAPTLTMKGVTNNGKTNGVVVLSDVTEDAEVKVFLNDEEIEYTVGEELSEIGKYKVDKTLNFRMFIEHTQ